MKTADKLFYAIFAITIFFLLTCQPASAFQCVSGTSVNQQVRVQAINQTAPCAAGTFAILNTAEITNLQGIAAQIAAVSAVADSAYQAANISPASAVQALINSADIQTVFEWGFYVVAGFASLGIVIIVAVQTVKKA